MSDPAEALSDDIDALRALVRSALVERDAARAERDHAVSIAWPAAARCTLRCMLVLTHVGRIDRFDALPCGAAPALALTLGPLRAVAERAHCRYLASTFLCWS